MAETPAPTDGWAILHRPVGEKELRLVAVYLRSEDAILDSCTLQTEGAWVEVIPWPVHRASQWSSHREPALEQTDDDFDVPLDIPGP